MATARLRTQLWSAGTTYHGACRVDVWAIVVLVRVAELRPQLAIVEVALAELPTLRRVVETILQAARLLDLGDVEEALDDTGALVVQQALELVDVPEPLAPHRAWNQPLDAHDEHVLVVTAVEDADVARHRACLMGAPQVVVLGLDAGRGP